MTKENKLKTGIIVTVIAGALIATGVGLILTANNDTDTVASITGTVITENTSEKHIANVTLYNSNDLDTVIAQTETEEDGTFLLDVNDIEDNEYTVVIEKEGYLKQTVNKLTLEDGYESQIGTYKILAGDTDNSGEIELDDLITLNKNWGNTNSKSDLNEDGIVDNLDREILKSNYGKKEQIASLGINYKLSYDANEGIGAPSGIIKYDNNIFTISSIEPTREGYTFSGWYDNAEGTGIDYSETITIDENKTLYAKWNIENNTITAEDIASEPEKYYGQYVTNYVPTNGDTETEWRVFYADEEEDKLYLIADDYIEYDYMPKSIKGTALNKGNTNYNAYFNNTNIVKNDYRYGTNEVIFTFEDKPTVLTKWNKWINKWKNQNQANKNDNVKAVAYMLDISVWKAYKDTTYADYAIGGATLEMFIASYNQTHSNGTIDYDYTGDTGYKVKYTTDPLFSDYIIQMDRNNSLYLITSTTRANQYYLSAPSESLVYTLMSIHKDGALYTAGTGEKNVGFRPVVCLQSGVSLKETVDGNYELVLE